VISAIVHKNSDPVGDDRGEKFLAKNFATIRVHCRTFGN